MKRTFTPFSPYFLSVVFASATLFGLPQPTPAQEKSVNWRFNYAAARKEAKEKSLPMILEFGTPQCHWCNVLEQNTLSNPVVSKTINENFVALKINANLEPALTQALQVTSYPTVILADADGKILGTMEGYKEANFFQEKLLRALALVANPEWMLRDYHAANKALGVPDYAKAVTLLKSVVEDGKSRPIQIKAKKLLDEIETQAAGQLAKAQSLTDQGQAQDAVKVLTELVRMYPGTRSASMAGQLMTDISNKSPAIAKMTRNQRARHLLTLANEDYRLGQHLCCLDRCKTLMKEYPEFDEANQAKALAASIMDNPKEMEEACQMMTARLGNMYLMLADSYLRKNDRQKAITALQHVLQFCPGSQHAELAAARLNQLNGEPTLTVDFQKN